MSESVVRFIWPYEGSSVRLAAPWNKWQGERMTFDGSVWMKDVKLGEGVYQYKFIVDGRWCYDILKKNSEDSDGNINNVIEVGPQNKKTQRQERLSGRQQPKDQPKTITKEQPKKNIKEQSKKDQKEQPKKDQKEQPKKDQKEQPKKRSKRATQKRSKRATQKRSTTKTIC